MKLEINVSAVSARKHRRLGALCVAHAVLILGMLLLILAYRDNSAWANNLWVGITVLWILWPMALILAPGRSIRRVVIPILLSACFILICIPHFDERSSSAFHLPFGVRLNPSSLLAYWNGRVDAKKDIQKGQLGVEIFGGPGYLVPAFHELRERFGIEARPVAACVVNTQILGHAVGYNKVMASEVKRRFGVNIIDPRDGLPATKPVEELAHYIEPPKD